MRRGPLLLLVFCLAMVSAASVEIRVGADDAGNYLPSGETPADALWTARQKIAEIKKPSPQERIYLKAVNAEGKGKPVCLGCGKFWLISGVKWNGPQEMTNRVGKSILVGDPRSDAFFSKGDGWDWWLNRVKRNRDQIRASGGKIDLVLMGDSITHYWETRCSNSWARLVARYGNVLNCGDAGDKVNNLLWRAEGGELDGYEAKAVVILIGTNDNHFPTSDPANVAKGIAHLVDVVKAKQPKARIVLMAILPRGNGKNDGAHHQARARNEKTNALIRKLADGKRVLWLDLTAQLSDPETGWARRDCFVDRCHPSEKGYEIWMEGLETALGPDRRVQWEKKRPDILSWFEENFYGRAPVGRPDDLTFSPSGFFCADGKVRVKFEVRLPPGASGKNPVPVIVFGDHYRDGKPYPDVPVEEILRRGYAFVRYNFNEIAPDRKVDDPARIAGVFKAYGGWDKPDGWGKVAAWAWGFSRVVDWIGTRPELDAARVTVVGHSRGGKTALWAAANDARIALAVANGSGTGGAHLNSLVTPGSEQVSAFLKANSWNFFCPNFLKLEGRETKLAHDADDLLRLIAPRPVYVASGSKDTGAGPQGEFEAARRAGELWEAYGRHGVSLKAYPAPGAVDHAGDIGYHLHDGRHVLGVWDWQRILDFADAKLRSGINPVDSRRLKAEFRDGAKGSMRTFVADGKPVVEIVKENDLGFVVVKPAQPVPLKRGVAYRTSAVMETSTSDPEYDCGFLRLFGAKENLAHYGALDPRGRDGGPSRTRLMNVRTGRLLVKVARFRPETETDAALTPAIVVCGPASTSRWIGWSVEEESTAALREAAGRTGRTPRDRQADVQPSDTFRSFVKSDVQHTAKLERRGETTRLLLDGRPAVPVLYRSVGNKRYGKFVYDGKDMLASGVELQVTDIRLGSCPQWKGFWSPAGFDAAGAADEIETSMRTAPQAFFLLGLCLSPYPEFSSEHPDEVHRLPDGRRLFGDYNNADTLVKDGEAVPAKLWPWISVYSPSWQDGVKRCLSALVAELRRRGLDKRIVGFHLTGFHDGQFATRRLDASAPARAAYNRWRAEKGLSPSDPPTNVVTRLLSPETDADRIEYVRFQQRGYYRVVEDISRHFKKCFGKDVLSVRWCMSAFAGAYYGSYDISDFVRSDTLDILVAQAAYRRRMPGIACGLRLPVESFARNGKLFVNELDLRTYAIAAVSESVEERLTMGEAADADEWRTINRRQVGQMLAHRQGFWYYDMAGGWFDDPPIRKDIADVVRVARDEIVRPSDGWRPSAAFVIDEDGALLRNYLIGYGECHEARLVADQIHLLASSGVPYDTFLMDDFLRDPDSFRRYRTIVFADAYAIDAARRQALRHVQGENRTLVFLGGSGILEGAAVTGFDPVLKPNSDDHDVIAEPSAGVNQSSILTTLLMEKFLGERPIGYYRCDRYAVRETEKLRVMARFAKDRAVAVAERAGKGWRSVYVAEGGGLTPQYFNRLVRESGGYVPVEGGLQVEMNGGFVSVHCLKPGHYNFMLPRRCSVTGEDGKTAVSNGTTLPLDLKTDETLWYSLR